LTPADRARLTVLAFLHDLGKFNHGFQRKASKGMGPTAGHVREAVAALPRLSSLQPLDSWGEAAFDLLVVALCHHAGLEPARRTRDDDLIVTYRQDETDSKS
jgi:CRISPR-associated endonuclease/helicase Cas3